MPIKSMLSKQNETVFTNKTHCINFSSCSGFNYIANGLLVGMSSFLSIFAIQLISNNAYIANTGGYLTGGVVGFFLHSKYTFNVPRSPINACIYMIIVATGFTLNLFALKICTQIMPIAPSQLISVSAYVCYSYILQKSLLRRK